MRRSACLSSLLAASLLAPGALYGGTVSFTTHSTASQSTGVAVYQHADLNNDGREDLAYVPEPEFGTHTVFAVQLSNGDGTYGTTSFYTVPQGTGTVIVNNILLGDFNSSGREDILAFADNGNVYLFRNNGAGTFSLGGTFAYTSGQTSSNVQAVAADFNHDSRQDLAYLFNGQLHIWFGNGNYGFTTGPTTPVSLAGVPGLGMQLGDFDGDGAADLAMQDTATSELVLYGDNTGHFLKTTLVTAATQSVFNAADVNSDGKMDLVATQYSPAARQVAVFYGDGARTFASRTAVGLKYCAQTNGVSAADLDGNGINDLVVDEFDCTSSPYPAEYIGVRTRNSNASYNAEQTIYTSTAFSGGHYSLPESPLVLRADRNSKPDLLIEQCTDDRCDTWNDLDLLNTTAGNFPSCSPPNALVGINVCSPVLGTSAASPVRFAIGAAGPVIQRKVEVWVDGKKLAEQLGGFSNYTFLNRSLSLTPGSHAVTIFAAGWDNSLQKKSFTLGVQ